ncbi:MAG: hypothetical protein V2A64_01650 [Candidatus Omnitrophota bacterium]
MKRLFNVKYLICNLILLYPLHCALYTVYAQNEDIQDVKLRIQELEEKINKEDYFIAALKKKEASILKEKQRLQRSIEREKLIIEQIENRKSNQVPSSVAQEADNNNDVSKTLSLSASREEIGIARQDLNKNGQKQLNSELEEDEPYSNEQVKISYDQAVVFYYSKDYEQAQAKFEQVSQLIPHYLNTDYYLVRISEGIQK